MFTKKKKNYFLKADINNKNVLLCLNNIFSNFFLLLLYFKEL